MNKFQHIDALKNFAIKFKEDGNLVELMKIQSDLAAIACGFRVMSPKDQEGFCERQVRVSEHALDALKDIEKVKYHAGVKTLQDPTIFGESVTEVLYKAHLDWEAD